MRCHRPPPRSTAGPTIQHHACSSACAEAAGGHHALGDEAARGRLMTSSATTADEVRLMRKDAPALAAQIPAHYIASWPEEQQTMRRGTNQPRPMLLISGSTRISALRAPFHQTWQSSHLEVTVRAIASHIGGGALQATLVIHHELFRLAWRTRSNTISRLGFWYLRSEQKTCPPPARIRAEYGAPAFIPSKERAPGCPPVCSQVHHAASAECAC